MSRVERDPLRLHIGCGDQRLEGWINIDIRPLPAVDIMADVTAGLDFVGVEAIYAEHFLEHLAVDDGLDFLAEAHRVLASEGRIRLSTPNFDWVWATHYRLEADADDKIRAGVALNRAFYGWGHRFLWNRETLRLALRRAGFRDIGWCSYGHSRVATLHGLERHERSNDTAELPHVLIVEARRGTPDPEGLGALRERFRRELIDHVAIG